MTRPSLKTTLRTAGLALLAAAALWLATEQAIAIYRAAQAEAWPVVPGHVTESRVADGCGRGGGYYPVVRYRYVTGGTWHDSDRIRFGGTYCGTRDEARAVTAEYPANRTLRVRINPADASDAVLSTKIDYDIALGFALLSGLALLFGAGAVFSHLSAQPARSRN